MNKQLDEELKQANMEILELRNSKEKIESELIAEKNHIDKLHTSKDLIESQLYAQKVKWDTSGIGYNKAQNQIDDIQERMKAPKDITDTKEIGN